MEYELAGVVRYTHYSLMVFGFNRLPIISWLKKEAEESLAHAHAAGEMITHIGGHPSLEIGPLLETHKHDIGDILREVYGRDARLWGRRWRLFFLATAGLFGHDQGEEWGVSHYRLRPAPAVPTAVLPTPRSA